VIFTRHFFVQMVKRIGIVLVILAISLSGLEILSFVFVSHLSDNPGNDHLQAALNRGHPVFVLSQVESDYNPTPPYRLRSDANPFQYDPRHSYRFRPGKFWTKKAQIGPQGFICNGPCQPLLIEKPANELRIFMFGGSTVAGPSSSESIPTYLEQRLRSSFGKEDIRVINLGVGGYSSTQELTYFALEYAQYQPDLVIFFNGYNDYLSYRYHTESDHIGRYWPYVMANRVAYDYTIMEGLDLVARPSGAVLHALNLLGNAFPVLYYTQTLAKHVRQAVLSMNRSLRGGDAGSPARKNDGVPTTETRSPATDRLLTEGHNSVATYARNLRAASAIAKDMGIAALFVLQPALIDSTGEGNAPTKPLLTKTEKAIRLLKSPYVASATAYFDAARAQFRLRMTAETNPAVLYCDLTALFNDVVEEVYTDEIHYNARGNQLIAGKMAAFIERAGMLGGTSDNRSPECQAK